MNWFNIVIALFSNPAIQALIKQIEAQFSQKTSAQGMAMDQAEHAVTMKQVVDEVVAKHMRTPS